MGTVNKGREVGGGGVRKGIWGDEISVNGEGGKYFCPNFLQHLPENVDRKSCYDGSLQFIPVMCKKNPIIFW